MKLWDSASIEAFRSTLLAWGQELDRPMPWKGVKNPYVIWLSEIILQQTRVEQGRPYFERFLARFPTVEDLAQASEDEVFKLWEGLGYYSRARNLHFTAKFIANQLNGQFPDTYDTILNLKGVGPYTAAAIASFAYNLPHAVVDGNVYRVISRLMGIETPVDTTAGKKEIKAMADSLLDPKHPGRYNQAMMDFGAVLCTPKSPGCKQCPFQQQCVAFQHNKVGQLPVKQKRLQRRDRFFQYVELQYQGITWICQRTQKDIWQKLYEFPLLETQQLAMEEENIISQLIDQQWVSAGDIKTVYKSKPFKQVLSHQNIFAHFWKIELSTAPAKLPGSFIRTKRENLFKFAFPKIIDWYLNDKSLYLKL
jgi:A/G-specific adenine glycosylase